MAWKIKRGNIWSIGWRENGRDYYTSTGTADESLAEIERLAKELALKSNQGKSTPKASTVSFSMCAELYKKQADLTEKTHETNANSWKKWVEYAGDTNVRGISVEDVLGFKQKLVQKGYAPASVSIYLRDVNKLFGFAVRKNWMAANPCKLENSDKWAVDLPDDDPHNFHVLTKEEELKLLEKANQALRRILPFALETGLRLDQIATLDWKQYDPKQHLLKIPPQKRQKIRHIPLLDRPVVSYGGISALEAMGPVKMEGSVFGIRDGNQIKQMYARLRRACGFTKMVEGKREYLFDFHDLRHTCASRLARILDPHELRDFFGWSSLALVDRYTHSSAKDIREKLSSAA